MEYKKLEPITKNEVESIVKTSKDEYILAETLFRMVYSIDDPDFVEKNIIIFANMNLFNSQVIVSISDFARVYRFLPKSLKKLLIDYKNDKNLIGLVSEIEEDIKVLLKNHKK